MTDEQARNLAHFDYTGSAVAQDMDYFTDLIRDRDSISPVLVSHTNDLVGMSLNIKLPINLIPLNANFLGSTAGGSQFAWETITNPDSPNEERVQYTYTERGVLRILESCYQALGQDCELLFRISDHQSEFDSISVEQFDRDGNEVYFIGDGYHPQRERLIDYTMFDNPRMIFRHRGAVSYRFEKYDDDGSEAFFFFDALADTGNYRIYDGIRRTWDSGSFW